MSESILRLYGDLSWLWPLWDDATDPSGDYAAWCEHVTRLIREYSKIDTVTLLNMGCGGGKNAYNLKKHFNVTGIDISSTMLDQARQLNPDCEFALADMRTDSLDSVFDAVLVDDAITHITTLADLTAVFQNAYRHLRPGGVMVVAPDTTKDTFQQNCTRVSYADKAVKPDNIEVVFIENDYDPDPDDDTYQFTLIYLIREDGKLRIETDQGIGGLFTLDVWRQALREAGFEVSEERYVDSYTGHDLPTFACVKPL